MAYIFTPPTPPCLIVDGSKDLFPVHRIYCVGRNYAAHSLEMGHDPEREAPFFFCKPADAITQSTAVPFPPRTHDLHHEVELVIALGSEGRNIAPQNALDHVFAYGVGVDLTRRDLQTEAKKQGRPWDMAKGFDASAPMSALKTVNDIGHPHEGRIWLDVDGQNRQQGNIDQHIWGVGEIIAHLSSYVTLKQGDLIMSGTPCGVGPLNQGANVSCGIEGITHFSFTIGHFLHEQ